MTEKKALGKGLSALIPEKIKTREGTTMLNISEVYASRFQPREDFNPEKLNDLILSIKEKGVIQPILVRAREEEDGYELIAGERRLRAARAVGIEEIPAIIKDVDDTELLEISLIENIQRENLNPLEQAHAYRRLMEEFGLSQEDIARAVSKDRTTIANILRLLGLPDFIRKSIQNSEITLGHAKALLSLSSAAGQIEFCKKIIKENLSVRQAENFVSTQDAARRKRGVKTADPHLIALEEDLQRRLGTKVIIKAGRKRGSIKIEFYSNSDLDRILSLIANPNRKPESEFD
jgi:ParB family chromosome partitioning protein